MFTGSDNIVKRLQDMGKRGFKIGPFRVSRDDDQVHDMLSSEQQKQSAFAYDEIGEDEKALKQNKDAAKEANKDRDRFYSGFVRQGKQFAKFSRAKVRAGKKKMPGISAAPITGDSLPKAFAQLPFAYFLFFGILHWMDLATGFVRPGLGIAIIEGGIKFGPIMFLYLFSIFVAWAVFEVQGNRLKTYIKLTLLVWFYPYFANITIGSLSFLPGLGGLSGVGVAGFSLPPAQFVPIMYLYGFFLYRGRVWKYIAAIALVIFIYMPIIYTVAGGASNEFSQAIDAEQRQRAEELTRSIPEGFDELWTDFRLSWDKRLEQAQGVDYYNQQTGERTGLVLRDYWTVAGGAQRPINNYFDDPNDITPSVILSEIPGSNLVNKEIMVEGVMCQTEPGERGQIQENEFIKVPFPYRGPKELSCRVEAGELEDSGGVVTFSVDYSMDVQNWYEVYLIHENEIEAFRQLEIETEEPHPPLSRDQLAQVTPQAVSTAGPVIFGLYNVEMFGFFIPVGPESEVNEYSVAFENHKLWDGSLLKVNSLEFTMPKDIELTTGDNCDFDQVSDSNGRKTYRLRSSETEKIIDPDIIKRYECPINLKDASKILADTNGRRKINIITTANIDYRVSTEVDVVYTGITTSNTDAPTGNRVVVPENPSEQQSQVLELVRQAACRYDVPATALLAIVDIETGHDFLHSVDGETARKSKDPENSYGAMQINSASRAHPGCYDLDAEDRGICDIPECDGETAFDMRCNIFAGANHFREQFEAYEKTGLNCEGGLSGWYAAARGYNGAGACPDKANNYVDEFESRWDGEEEFCAPVSEFISEDEI